MTGFGRFSANLLAFINPMGLSRFLRSVHTPRGQIEGFSYLGFGLLVLIVIAVITTLQEIRSLGVRNLWQRFLPFIPLALVALAAFVYALATPVYFADTAILSLNRLYSPLQPLTQVFRVSGRFVWLLQYCIILATMEGS